uniref:Uncharacterized protein n=1 Tax=viral metagenome TaxID=1070528 RepID=A0A6C0JNZ5_9ZZZZ
MDPAFRDLVLATIEWCNECQRCDFRRLVRDEGDPDKLIPEIIRRGRQIDMLLSLAFAMESKNEDLIRENSAIIQEMRTTIQYIDWLGGYTALNHT